MSAPLTCPEATVATTALGPAELHLTAGDGPVVLASHGGIGGPQGTRNAGHVWPVVPCDALP